MSDITATITSTNINVTIKGGASQPGGGGDMRKAVYDTNDNGVVDNSQALEGNGSSYHLNRANHTGTQLASTIFDFDNEVTNNSDVAANTGKRHDAVTVADTTEINMALNGQEISSSLNASSVSASKLDSSVNDSLNLANSALQPADIGTDVQAFNTRLAEVAGLSFSEGDLLYFNGTNIVKLAMGTPGQVLTVNAGATAPEWADATGGGGGGGGGAGDFEQLFSFDVTTSTPSITFSSIPQTAKSLKVVANLQSNRPASFDGLLIQLNGSAVSSNYRSQRISGQGVSEVATSYDGIQSGFLFPLGATAATSTYPLGAVSEMLLQNYNSTTARYKGMTGLYAGGISGTTLNMGAVGGNFDSGTIPAAITSITFVPQIGTAWAAGSVQVYGLS